ncbi:concanavalin A-like lectin protein kinase family protein [Actinidia rufa]|uniref:Concanavalin A-like lectin protein kinase family protein n=1 Tax=Actinidia rufa TaxID=165716 RepID=A0A7J0EV40_9ERIC|nr:concanavalin A-like lectin protein kinase family protein [Actinidia rufa]
MTQHHLPLMVTIFLFLIIPFVAPLSFNFTNFSPDNADIQYERAYAVNNVIQLTTNLASIGRASYAKPLQLWDRASGKLTNFTTQFSFTIDSHNRSAYGDGIAFFLAPVGSRIPEGITKGGSLGLTRDDQPLNSTDNPFVAVEFDIYQNLWDPEHDHVAIDSNSMRSVDNVTWLSSVLDGKQNHAWISYDSSLRNLSVVFTGFMGNSSVRQGLSHIVDLRDHLPEWVIFGFSSATGNASAVQSIQSWSFSSTLEIGEKTSKGNTGLVVGLAVGGGVLVCGLCGLVVFVYWKKRRENEDDPEFDEIMDEELERGTGPRKFSLDSHLFKGKSTLTWPARYKIAQDLASALLYLHEEWEQCVVHRDIKSSNVLLDSNFNAKLGDFGLARLVDHEKGSQTTVLAGTMGYMAPECVITGRASKESDVFSFGVVAVEIACGRKPINHKAQESEINMVEWVWSLYGFGKLIEAADPKLGGDFDEQEMERLMIVGLWCAHPHSRSRPSIRQVIQTLNFEASMPILPSEMPVATYLAPSMNKSSLQPSNDGTSFGSSQIQSLNFTFNTDSSQLTESSAASSSTSSLLKTA